MIYGVFTFKNEDYATTLHHPESPIIVMGASHAQESFNPLLMAEELGVDVFNLGGPGHNPLFLEYQTRLLLKKKSIPNLVILTITYNTINDYVKPHVIASFIQEGNMLRTTSYLMKMQNFNTPRKIFLSDIYSSSYRVLTSRSLSFLKNREFESPMPRHHERGYFGKNIELQPGIQPAKISQRSFQTNTQMIEGLKNCLSLWRKKNVQVVVVDTPEFYGTRLASVEYDKFEDLMHELSENEGFIFKSFNRLDQPEQKNPELFRDGGWGIPNSHLNRKGAIWFNKIFCEWLQKTVDLKSL
jgi:hypothetical protein